MPVIEGHKPEEGIPKDGIAGDAGKLFLMHRRKSNGLEIQICILIGMKGGMVGEHPSNPLCRD